MKRFLNELKKISNKDPISKTILEVSEKAIIDNNNNVNVKKILPYCSNDSSPVKNNEKSLISTSTKKSKESDINSAVISDNNMHNIVPRIKKSFVEKHGDSELINFFAKDDESYYTKTDIDVSKDNLFTELTVLRDILTEKKLLEQPIVLSKEIALFYTTENPFNGENRGKILNKKCEMFSDKFKDSSVSFHNANLSAEKLSNPIQISGKHKIQITLHSKLKEVNCDSYKNAHEVVVAKQISAETGNEIFVSGDCGESDPELVSWIGNLPVKKYKGNPGQLNKDIYQKVLTKKGTFKVVRGGDIKHRSAPKIIENKQLGDCDKEYDLYISVGTVDENSSNKIIDTVAKNVLDSKYKEYIKLTANPNSSKEDIDNLAQEIKDIQKYQTKKDLENLNCVENIHKVVFNSHNVKLKCSSSDNELGVSTQLVD